MKDALGLVKRFVDKGSPHFKDFQEEWQESQFYFIHCVGREESQKAIFTDVLFSSMTDVVTNQEAPMIERIGALYVWYGVYCTQLSPGAIKVRLTISDWMTLELLHTQLRREGYLHADYLLCLLKSYSAFFVCAYRKRFYPGQIKEDVGRETSSAVEQQLINLQSPLLQQLQQVHQLQNQYTELKESLREHLPPHLLTSPSSLGELLKPERLRAIAGEITEQEVQAEVPSTVEEEQGGSEVTRRRRVLYGAYTSAPSTGRRH